MDEKNPLFLRMQQHQQPIETTESKLDKLNKRLSELEKNLLDKKSIETLYETLNKTLMEKLERDENRHLKELNELREKNRFLTLTMEQLLEKNRKLMGEMENREQKSKQFIEGLVECIQKNTNDLMKLFKKAK